MHVHICDISISTMNATAPSGQGYPYPGPQYPNTMGPPPYAWQQQPMNPNYMQPAPPAPIIVQTIHRPSSTTNHALCFLVCFLTGGLSIPCWIIACITE